MKKWLVVCAIVCSLTVQGCVLVFAPHGPLEPYGVLPEEFEMRERELNERAEHLEIWERELSERQEILEEEFGEHEEEEDVDWDE